MLYEDIYNYVIYPPNLNETIFGKWVDMDEVWVLYTYNYPSIYRWYRINVLSFFTFCSIREQSFLSVIKEKGNKMQLFFIDKWKE